MYDLISRQAAIDGILAFMPVEIRKGASMVEQVADQLSYSIWRTAISCAESYVRTMPSAEPEIIHCGDCKYKDDGIDEDGIPFLKCLNGRSYGGTRINDYCSWAERRTDGSD